MFKPTHTGVVELHARGRRAIARVPLRETKLFYVSKYGTHYRKADGEEVESVLRVNKTTLLLDTIRGIGDERICAVDAGAASPGD
jgi:hypothetical protein